MIMKKLLFCASALAMLLFAGSCQKENLEPEKGGDTVTFTVSAPGQIQTKAIADGMNVDVLHYEVYSREDGASNHLENYDHAPLAKGHVSMKQIDDPDNPGQKLNSATVDLDLIKDQDLTIIFWAQKKSVGFYNVTTDGSTDLRRISFRKSKLVEANVENRAAFFKRFDFNTNANNNYEVKLVRPFSQINLGTTTESLNPTQQGQTTGYSIEVLESAMTIKGISTTFNTVKGVAESDNLVDVTFKSNATPYQQTGEELTVQDKPFHYVSMNYLFVPAGEKLVEVSYTVKTDKGNVENTIINVPVKQNYRTNIIGNLLTQKTKFDIVVDEDFNKSDIDLKYEADGIVQVNPDLNLDASATPYTKMYEISSANGFVYAMMEIVPNMKTGESAEFYLISSINMTGVNYVPPTLKAGTTVLLTTGAAPVTRAASEITISGLDSPIFAKVDAGATLTFSDIVVEDHEATAALVGEVESGANVMVHDCEASNSADADVPLIGSGDVVDINEGVSTLEQLQAALRTSADPIILKAALTIAAGQDVVLDLKGKLVQHVLEPADIMFRVNGKLTLTGNGQINSTHYIASANAGGEIKVENGGFTAETTCFQANGGKVFISDGRFSVTGEYGSTYLLNHIDSQKENGLIAVSGGTFVGYDPAKSASESPAMNFVAKDYVSVSTGDNKWTVRPDLYKEGSIYYAYNSNGFQKALKLNEPRVEITLVEDVTVDVNAWDDLAFGGDKSETIIIYGKNNTITFNQLNSDWNNIATKNNAKLYINNAHLTSSGHNDGPWNRHDLNFACDVNLEYVTSDKAIALKAGGTLTKVDIKDANKSDTYALWIQPNGQTVTLNNCLIDMIDCTDGRGIKIDEQYVEKPGKVTLNVNNTIFKTEEKGAILVKSVAGADINLTGINISEVKADSKNAVWVDSDSAKYYDLVTVTGGTKYQEE